MKKIFKVLGIILFIIIPIVLIILNMFFDFFGYIELDLVILHLFLLSYII